MSRKRTSMGLGSFVIGLLLPSISVAGMYWCPNKLGGIYQDYADPGCAPVLEKKQEETKTDQVSTGSVVPIGDIEKATESLNQEYRRLLAGDLIGEDAKKQIEALEERAAQLIEYTQHNLSRNKFYQLNGRGIILELTQLQNQVRDLKARVDQLTAAKGRLPELGDEQAATERRRIQETEESMQREFKPFQQPNRAATGRNIGSTPTAGEAIGSSGRSGNDIGATPQVGRDIGNTPAFGLDIGATPNAGPGIGTTPRAGSAIGDSDLNRTP